MKTAVIIGAGPAGLTAAYELLKRTDIKPVIFEATADIGGISKTLNYKGNRIDIGGHRFFSKSQRVMNWWRDIMPVITEGDKNDHGISSPTALGSDSRSVSTIDEVFLIRKRLSRIYFMRRFFDYPISLSLSTIRNLGILRTIRIGIGYFLAKLLPRKREISLEDFFINRFGGELYRTFFRDYTEKVWGISCREIPAEWGAQRIKGLSVGRALLHALKRIIPSKNDDVEQKKTETSLIEQFLYPKFGPGQFWERVAALIETQGGEIRRRHTCLGFKTKVDRISVAIIRDENTGKIFDKEGDWFFSTMPVKDLIAGLDDNAPEDVVRTAQNLQYRDFITVGLLVKKLRTKGKTEIKVDSRHFPDNWIYIQERDVKIGRLQIFNNWSPYMVAQQDTVWMGLEYFCQEGDNLWNLSDEEFTRMAVQEMVKLDFIEQQDVLDATVIRMPKTYPAYFGSYKDFHLIRKYVDRFLNLFLIGRNGMHRYNNQDHSMLTAMMAVDNIAGGIMQKDNIWQVNTEQEYHEAQDRNS